MTRGRKLLLILALAPLVIIQFGPFCIVSSWIHMFATLERAKREGVFATPADGMRARVEKSWIGVEKIEIQYAGPNSFDGSNPHVGFVVARVWAAKRGDLKPISQRGYDSAGSYFLRVHDGWVHVPEGALPDFVGLCMRLFNYDG